MLLNMPTKRFNVSFRPREVKILNRLSAEWGLDVTNTLRHMVALVGKQEGIITEDEKGGKINTGAPKR
jgi:hypothetical protein